MKLPRNATTAAKCPAAEQTHLISVADLISWMTVQIEARVYLLLGVQAIATCGTTIRTSGERQRFGGSALP